MNVEHGKPLSASQILSMPGVGVKPVEPIVKPPPSREALRMRQQRAGWTKARHKKELEYQAKYRRNNT